MGQRCNLGIIENGQVTVYYDHWAANILDIELLWGPEIARKFIEERDAKPDSWLDDVWAEGGCVIDFDSKHLLWYGGEDIIFAPDLNLIHQELLQSQWTGWNVEWAKDGIFDIARKARIPLEVVSSNKKRYDENLVQPYIYEAESDKFFYADNVVSFIDRGRLYWANLYGDIESLGNNNLTSAKIVNLVQGFSEAEFERGKLLDPGWGEYRWGAHLDFDKKLLEYWSPNPSEGLQVVLKQKFEGWSVINHGPNYLWHEALVPAQDWPSVTLGKKLVLTQHYRQTISRKRTNPMVSVLASLAKEEAQNIQINTQTFEHRKGDKTLLQIKNDILDELETKIKLQD